MHNRTKLRNPRNPREGYSASFPGLDVVVLKSSTFFERLSSEDHALLFRRNTFFYLNFCFHSFDAGVWLDFESDISSSKSADEDLHVNK